MNVNISACIGCGLCYKVCPANVLSWQGRGEKAVAEHAERCIECGHCVFVCPQNAIVHEAFPKEKVHEIDYDIMPSADSLMELMRSRRSNRTITDKPIPQQSLDIIVQAARYAPTAENSRRVSWHVITDQEQLKRIDDAVMDFFVGVVNKLSLPVVRSLVKVFGGKKLQSQMEELSLMEEQRKQGVKPVIRDATAIVVFSAPKDYKFGYQDCNLSYQNASLMAQALGVSQVYLGFVQVASGMFGSKKTAQLLGIPADHKPFAIMALGMPAVKYRRSY